MEAPELFVIDKIIFPKQGLLTALQAVYPDIFADKTIDMLESYGPVVSDSSYMELQFVEVPFDTQSSTKEIIQFKRGDMLAMLGQLDPTHFAGREESDLDYYADWPDDPAYIQFIFKKRQLTAQQLADRSGDNK